MISLESATQFAAWLALEHPAAFAALAKMAPGAKVTSLMGLGDDGLDFFDSTDFSDSIDTSSIDTSGLDSAIPDFSASVDTSGLEIAPASADSVLGIDTTAPAAANSSSFWSGVGSTLSSVGSGVTQAVGSVGSYLTSSAGMNTLAGLAKTYFTAQGQQAALQTQLARANAGLSPAPIALSGPYGSGVVTLPNGQIVAATPQSLQSYLPGISTGTLSLSNPIILIGGALILVFALMSARRA